MSDTTPTRRIADPDDTVRSIGQRTIAAGDARTLVIRRHYAAPVETVWGACTDPDWLERFFLRPSGDLREGGSFSLEGNASGDIVRCLPPSLLSLTWAYADRPVDEVELRFGDAGDGGTWLELDHATVSRTVTTEDGREIDPFLNDALSGMFGMGAGWELGLLALDAVLNGQTPAAGQDDEQMATMMVLADRCGEGWAAVVPAAGATHDSPAG